MVGASEKAGTVGNALIRNFIDGGFSGTVLSVNLKYQIMHGQAYIESVIGNALWLRNVKI